MADHSKIAVVEGQWFEKSNLSMRRIFDLMCESEVENINGYHYEMAFSKEALKEALPRLIGKKHISYIFLGQHGDCKNKLILPNGSSVSIKNLGKMIDEKQKSKFRLRGLHLSSCGLLSKGNAILLLESDKIDWVSGYENECDWLESTLIDTLFASYLYNEDESSSRKQIEEVAKEVWRLAKGMAKDAGFVIYRKKGDGVVRLTPSVSK